MELILKLADGLKRPVDDEYDVYVRPAISKYLTWVVRPMFRMVLNILT